MADDEIRRGWPLHWMVWKDDRKGLKRLLQETSAEYDLEQVDPRGRTPLHLAVTLNRVSCADLLLQFKADPLAVNRHRWSVLNEAVCTGNPELIGLVLRYREQRQEQLRTRDVPLMLERLQQAPDYYMEMNWEFSSWLPFVSRMCPSDTCHIWKKGTTVRVDTTLVGFDHLKWQRGRQTLIFQATAEGHRVCDINHDDKTVWEKEFKITQPDPLQSMLNLEMGVLQRLSSPVISTFVSTDDMTFQRQKSGIWGFRSDKTENIDGYAAKVFSTAGMEIVTQTRVEHLPETEKHKQSSINPLQDFLGAAQDHAQNQNRPPAIEALPRTTPTDIKETVCLSMDEYFTQPMDKKEYDAICRPPEINRRVQKLKATVYLAEKFPLSLQDQIMPIIDLMAITTPHFAKIKDFINMQMPSGFPVKLEIPLFHVISAKVSFTNINGHTTPVTHVTRNATRKRAGPVAVLTPSSSSSSSAASPLAEMGGVKHRHAQASGRMQGTSVDGPTEDVGGEELGGVAYEESEEVEECQIDDECFAIPAGYRRLQGSGRGTADQEEELLQMAIQQSLMDQPPTTGEGKGEEEEEKLSLQEVMMDETVKNLAHPQALPPPTHQRQRLSAEEEEFQLALAMSKAMAEREREEREREQREEEELQRVLKMSLEDK